MLFFALLLALRLTPSAPDAPLKQPQIAVSGKTVNLTYGVGNAVYFARSNDSGKTFSDPSRWRSRKLYAGNAPGATDCSLPGRRSS